MLETMSLVDVCIIPSPLLRAVKDMRLKRLLQLVWSVLPEAIRRTLNKKQQFLTQRSVENANSVGT